MVEQMKKDICIYKKDVYKIWDKGYLLVWIPDTKSREKKLLKEIQKLRTIYECQGMEVC